MNDSAIASEYGCGISAVICATCQSPQSSATRARRRVQHPQHDRRRADALRHGHAHAPGRNEAPRWPVRSRGPLIAEVAELDREVGDRLLTSAIACCRSSRFAPDTRTASPWIDACTFILLSLTSLTIFFDRSCSMPTRIVTGCFTLLPETFSIVPYLSARMSTPRFVSLPVTDVGDLLQLEVVVGVERERLVGVLDARVEPLKSKRVRLPCWSGLPALRTSTWFTSRRYRTTAWLVTSWLE
jgi:hypothetical protein